LIGDFQPLEKANNITINGDSGITTHKVITLNKLKTKIKANVNEKINNTNQFIQRDKNKSHRLVTQLKFFEESVKSYKLNTDAHKNIKGHTIELELGNIVSNSLFTSSWETRSHVLTISTIFHVLLKSISILFSTLQINLVRSP
jgi:hypothetical protein